MSSQPSPFTIITPQISIGKGCLLLPMESPTFSFVFSLLLAVSVSLQVDASKPSIPHITVVGVVYCDACSNNSFTHHSYFLPGAEVRIDCRFNAASPRTAEQISFTVNRTTNRHGVYKMDIPSVDGFNCARESSVLNTCRASLIRSTSPECNVPAYNIILAMQCSRQTFLPQQEHVTMRYDTAYRLFSPENTCFDDARQVKIQMFFFGASSIFFSVFALGKDTCTTACIVITPFGSSSNGVLHWPTVLLFSKNFPAFISLTSFADLGPPFLSLGHSATTLAFSRRVSKRTNIGSIKQSKL